MKTLAIVMVVAALAGCQESDEVWSLDLYNSHGNSCSLGKLDLYLVNRGGDVSGEVYSGAGALTVSHQGHGYRVELSDSLSEVTFVGELERGAGDEIDGFGSSTNNGCSEVSIIGTSMSLQQYFAQSGLTDPGVTPGECDELGGEDCPINWLLY